MDTDEKVCLGDQTVRRQQGGFGFRGETENQHRGHGDKGDYQALPVEAAVLFSLLAFVRGSTSQRTVEADSKGESAENSATGGKNRVDRWRF